MGHERNVPLEEAEQILDLGERTDGQPIYEGYAPAGTATSVKGWKIFKNTFTTVAAGDIRTRRQCVLKGVWDDRATLFS